MQLPDGEVIYTGAGTPAGMHPFLKTFGQPARELACECEREGDSNLARVLELMNGAFVLGRRSGARQSARQAAGPEAARRGDPQRAVPGDAVAAAAADEAKAALDRRGEGSATSARPGKTCTGRCSTPRSSCSGIER